VRNYIYFSQCKNKHECKSFPLHCKKGGEIGMKHTYFITGFPGFIASQIIRKLLTENHEYKQIYVLVQPPKVYQAEEEIEKLEEEFGKEAVNIEILKGDITVNNLALTKEELEGIKDEITHVFHLAAIYDLAVSREFAYEVNVKGTEHVNNFVLSLPNIKRYVYFSTAYIAGTREGMIYENEIIKTQQFRNFYEETKYKAEIQVRTIMKKVPTTIIRPGIVVGHSTTGVTMKFDGPYFLLNVFDKLKKLPVIPYLGSGDYELNIVPVDYVVDATVYLAFNEIGEGKTYHLTDPRPYKAREVYSMFLKEYLQKNPIGTIPLFFAKFFFSIPKIRKWLSVEAEAVDYFSWNARFDCNEAQKDLKDSGIICPDLRSYVDKIVRYYELHKDEKQKHIIIR
jgi:nucleoside-diphosphate-sugar epimerase